MRPVSFSLVAIVAIGAMLSTANALQSFSLRKPGHQVGDRLTDPKDGTVFVWVPAGPFPYGDENKSKSLGGFWIAKNDVTWKQYKRFCAATHRVLPSGIDMQGDHPATNIAWPDAIAYASWAGTTLPTESQWEKAARGKDGRTYPWGNDFDSAKCQSSVDSAKDSTSAVGSFPGGKSVYGCLDMAGNVNQWTLSYFDSDHPDRVVRGGSAWDSSADDFACTHRTSARATDREKSIGFRLCGPEIH